MAIQPAFHRDGGFSVSEQEGEPELTNFDWVFYPTHYSHQDGLILY